MDTYRKMTKALYRANESFAKVEGFFISISMAILTVVMTYQVITRYFLGIPATWAEEFCRYLFIWTSYIGGAYAVFHWNHIEIDLMDNIIRKRAGDPERALRVLRKVSILLVVAFLAYFLSVYSAFVQQIAAHGQKSAAMKIDMLIPMYSGIAGIVLMIIHGITLILMPEEDRGSTAEKAE